MKEQKGHKGGGMPYFEKDHWQKDVKDVMVADTKYASEMNTEEEYRGQVDKLAGYVKSHRMKY